MGFSFLNFIVLIECKILFNPHLVLWKDAKFILNTLFACFDATVRACVVWTAGVRNKLQYFGRLFLRRIPT